MELEQRAWAHERIDMDRRNLLGAMVGAAVAPIAALMPSQAAAASEVVPYAPYVYEPPVGLNFTRKADGLVLVHSYHWGTREWSHQWLEESEARSLFR